MNGLTKETENLEANVEFQSPQDEDDMKQEEEVKSVPVVGEEATMTDAVSAQVNVKTEDTEMIEHTAPPTTGNPEYALEESSGTITNLAPKQELSEEDIARINKEAAEAVKRLAPRTSTGSIHSRGNGGGFFAQVDQWELSLADVEIKLGTKPKDGVYQPAYYVSSIKGIDISKIKYNDLRKICVRLKLPKYKDQNKEGMLLLITEAKMVSEGLMPATSSNPDNGDDRLSSSYNNLSGPILLSKSGESKARKDSFNSKRKLPLSVTGSNARPRFDSVDGVAESNDEKPNAMAPLERVSPQLDEARIALVNLERFCKVSDRLRTLRLELKVETDNQNKQDIANDIELMQTLRNKLRVAV